MKAVVWFLAVFMKPSDKADFLVSCSSSGICDICLCSFLILSFYPKYLRLYGELDWRHILDIHWTVLDGHSRFSSQPLIITILVDNLAGPRFTRGKNA